MNSYIDFKTNNHLIKVEIEDKNQIIKDIDNIMYSYTGRLNAMFANSFIQESSHLIVNAISVFEQGYFDCAYYSLRQAIEVATVMSYICELMGDKRNEQFRKWRKQERFPMNKEMLRYLESNKSVYTQLKKVFFSRFREIERTKKKLNKHVHKQGYEYFYSARNYSTTDEKNMDKVVLEFLNDLRVCISAVAIMRLIIDPMPILLMDKDIYLRTGNMMTESFSKEFVNRYIGVKDIEEYKKTEFYVNHHNSIMQEEIMNESVADVVKNQFIDKSKISEILSQKHLLLESDYAAVVYSCVSDKISQVYLYDGLHMFFTNIDTVRTKTVWKSAFFNTVKNSEKKVNCKFDEAYISYFQYNLEDGIYVEHNQKLTEQEIQMLVNLRSNFA